MALTECRRFPSFQAALVAQSALRAAGVHAFVFDEFRASVVWTEQFALGGVRVMVPTDELEAAGAILGAPEASTPLDMRRPPRPRDMAALLVLLPLTLVVGWPLAGFRRADLFHRASALVLTIGLVAATIWILARGGRVQ